MDSCVGGCRDTFASGARAGHQLSVQATWGRRLLDRQRRLRGLLVEGEVLFRVGDLGCREGLHPLGVCQEGVAAWDGPPLSGEGWIDMDQGQQRAAPTLSLVFALRKAHDSVSHNVLWPTPEEEQEERRRVKKQRGDSRDYRERSRCHSHVV